MQVSRELHGETAVRVAVSGNGAAHAQSLQGRRVACENGCDPAILGVIARYLPLDQAGSALPELSCKFDLPVTDIAEREAFCGREQARFDHQVELFVNGKTKTLELGKAAWPMNSVTHFSFSKYEGLHRSLTAEHIKELFEKLFTHLPFLQELDLSSYHHLLKDGIASLQQFKQLTTLHISLEDDFLALSEEDWQDVGELTQLTSFILRASDRGSIPQAALQAVAALPNLTTLTLDNCYVDVDDDDLCLFAQLKGLKSLHITCRDLGRLSNEFLEVLASLPEIESITLNIGCDLSEKVVANLAKNKKTQKLKTG
jgi:hypothetical protein